MHQQDGLALEAVVEAVTSGFRSGERAAAEDGRFDVLLLVYNFLSRSEGDRILAAAKASGAGLVHPGYGFLAVNAEFAERVGAEGLTWVGPPGDAIRTMGSKTASRRLARDARLQDVYGYLLGLSEAEIEALAADGVI